MRILSTGWQNTNWKRTISCIHCGADLEVVQSDLRKYEVPGVGDQPSSFNIFCICMACKGELLLGRGVKVHEGIELYEASG